MAKEHFSHILNISGVDFTIQGTVDRDGMADISEVTVPDSIVNLWPVMNHYAGEDFQIACDDYLARQRQVEASWGYEVAA